MHECMSLGTSRVSFDVFNSSFPFNTSYFIKYWSSTFQDTSFKNVLLLQQQKIHCFMQQKQQTWKVFFVIIIKRRENMSLDSQVPRSIFTMYASKKNILENGDVTANLLYLGGLMSQILRENASAQIMLFRVSEIANFRSEMKESVTNKPFVCFPF